MISGQLEAKLRLTKERLGNQYLIWVDQLSESRCKMEYLPRGTRPPFKSWNSQISIFALISFCVLKIQKVSFLPLLQKIEEIFFIHYVCFVVLVGI